MARVLFALDLGGGYGHLRRCMPIVDGLAARGHDVAIAMRNSAYAAEVTGGRRHRVLATPAVDMPPGELAPVENWADVLLITGHGRPGVLGALLRGWRAIYARERPDLVVCDFAPSALMAATMDGLATVDIGSGYSPAPQLVPMAPIRFWADVPPARLADSEARALAAINAARAALGAGPLSALAESLAAGQVLLNCFPEFDHYGVRPGGAYFGNDFALADGVAADWPAGDGPRVFAYLRAGSRALAPVLAVLRRMGVRGLVHARDLKPEHAAALSGPTLRVSARPLRMREVVRDCAAFLCHSPATAAAGLVHGCPVLMLPEHEEQMMVALRLAERGLVQVPEPEEGPLEAALRHALEGDGVRGRAAAFARHYHGFDPADAIAAVVEACEAAMADLPAG